MPSSARWGILSTARINRRLIPPINESNRSEVLAVASRSQERAQQYAADWAIPRAYGTYEALLEDSDIDIVYISLPNAQHAQWTVKALHAGKHVLCEKPMCLSLKEWHAIFDAAESSGKTVQEGIMYLHHPQTAFIRSLVRDGAIGELRSMVSSFAFNWSRGEDNYRLTEIKGGGSLWDIGIYPVSLFHYITGKTPDKVTAFMYPESIDMRCTGMLSYPDGVFANFTVGFDSQFSTGATLIGSKGRIDIMRPYNYVDEGEAYLTQEDKVSRLELPKASLFSPEVENMNAIALDGVMPVVTLDQSRQILETILKIKR